MNIVVVNEKDEVIGVKERSQLDHPKDIYRVSGLWITNSNGEVLLAMRSLQQKNEPGKWGPAVAGTVDDGETYESTIYKEALEEIGLQGVRFKKAGKKLLHTHRRYFCTWYTVILDWSLDQFTLQEGEVDGLIWIDVHELKDDLVAYPNKYISSMAQIISDMGV